jgi:hypothetical protein
VYDFVFNCCILVFSHKKMVMSLLMGLSFVTQEAQARRFPV